MLAVGGLPVFNVVVVKFYINCMVAINRCMIVLVLILIYTSLTVNYSYLRIIRLTMGTSFLIQKHILYGSPFDDRRSTLLNEIKLVMKVPLTCRLPIQRWRLCPRLVTNLSSVMKYRYFRSDTPRELYSREGWR